MSRYFGRIASIPGDDGFAFIGIGSVTTEDGAPHRLPTEKDIFLHKDDCGSKLEVGMEVTFDIIPDQRRGEGTYRAVAAVKQIEIELLPKNEPPIAGFALTVPPVRSRDEIALNERLKVHKKMKLVPKETVEKVVANEPMPRIPRSNDVPPDEETKHELVQELLSRLFPLMEGFGADYRILNSTDEELDAQVAQAIDDYKAMDLEQQTEVLEEEVKRFKEVRAALKLMLEENLVRRDTIIPMSYLPDISMAVPVWYFWVNPETQGQAAMDWQNADPVPHPAVKYFCDLFPNQRWYNTFQLFNRRIRTLKQYKGETIPPAMSRRMRKAIELFDYVVIATPYHDEAGKDWEDINWLRAIDPYILGFKKGLPVFFVLARFSDAGTFPLFNELVADTVEFLRTRKSSLNGFNKIRCPYWHSVSGDARFAPHHASNEWMYISDNFGDYLMGHVDQLLAAFEAGVLFDWLRKEEASAD